jgi:hypothetical protein
LVLRENLEDEKPGHFHFDKDEASLLSLTIDLSLIDALGFFVIYVMVNVSAWKLGRKDNKSWQA